MSQACTHATKLSTWAVNVLDYRYGADPTGALDCSSSIAQADATAAGSVLTFGPGLYRVSSNLTISSQCVFLKGAQLYVDATKTVTLLKEPVVYGYAFAGAGAFSMPGTANIEWFGAVGGGVTNCAAAINKAIQASTRVFFPYHSTGYLIDATLTLDKSVALVGCEQGTKLIYAPSAAYDLFTIKASNVSVSNFQVVGNSTQTGWVFKLKSSVASYGYIYIDKINASLCAGFIADENSTGQITNLHVSECYHRQPTGRGTLLYDCYAFIFFRKFTCDYVGVATNVPIVYIDGNSGAVFEDCDLLGGTIPGTGSRWGFAANNCSAVWFKRCMADTLGGYGWRLTGCNYVYLENCSASLCDQHGFLINTSTNVQGSMMYVGGRNALAGTAGQHGVYVNASTVNLTGVLAEKCTGSGIYVDATGVSSISGARSSANTGYGILTAAGSITITTGIKMVGNVTNNYNLGGATDHIAGGQNNAGALVNVTGAAIG